MRADHVLAAVSASLALLGILAAVMLLSLLRQVAPQSGTRAGPTTPHELRNVVGSVFGTSKGTPMVGRRLVVVNLPVDGDETRRVRKELWDMIRTMHRQQTYSSPEDGRSLDQVDPDRVLVLRATDEYRRGLAVSPTPVPMAGNDGMWSSLRFEDPELKSLIGSTMRLGQGFAEVLPDARLPSELEEQEGEAGKDRVAPSMFYGKWDERGIAGELYERRVLAMADRRR